MKRERLRITVSGAVQGIGFRPAVYHLARDLGLAGFVRNRGAALEIEAEGERPQRLAEALWTAPPVGAQVADIACDALAVRNEMGFLIAESIHANADGVPPQALADLACCPACLHDVFDPGSRFYRYPFTNCSHCGPRYSIQRAVPYDRAATTMAAFRMCASCRADYVNPASRRFHAQPIACPDCGPVLAFHAADTACATTAAQALDAAVALVSAGGILALKGLGGYQLVVDACDARALARLRARKQRAAKPFAIMVGSLDEARRYARISADEAALLASAAAPIVLLERAGEALPEALAPGLGTLGIMLPTTPLHHLLLHALRRPVVCTSGNRADEPIATDDADARERLDGVADGWLSHDRAIHRPLDDSVARIIDGGPQLLRIGRGYAPVVLQCRQGPTVLACGGHLKNTQALAAAGRVIVSQHLGDLDDALSVDTMHSAAADLIAFHAVTPALAAVDVHPDYASRHCRAIAQLPQHSVQHHLAHALAVMLECNLYGPALAVVWDGSGLGSDGTLWGGEFLRVDRGPGIRWARVGHLRSFALPGGAAAAREPERALAGLLWEIEPLRSRIPLPYQRLLERQLNTPRSTSAGRLFDALAAVAGFRGPQRYEGEAAMRLEHAAASVAAAPAYPLPVTDGIVDWSHLVAAALADHERGQSAAHIGARLHAALAGAIVEQARAVDLETVLLSGGCFQNRLLTELATAQLRSAGFRPFIARRLPPHDGGLAAGQAVAVAEGVHC